MEVDERVVLVMGTILIILFWGDPDIADAIIHKLMEVDNDR